MIDIQNLKETNRIVARLAECRELFWQNDDCGKSEAEEKIVDIDEAETRLQRFAPFIKRMFPEVEDGIIESELVGIPGMKTAMAEDIPGGIKGRVFLKKDSHLPVSGSVKARGGIYEVLKLAEKIACERGMFTWEDDYAKLADPEFKALFSEYKVAVGSTGNLGLSIGIISAAIGFQVTVHMSADARQWKKDMLREKGVTVIEYPDDYEAAVAQGRKESEGDPMCHFVDDENSTDLFEGYAVAGKRLKKYMDEQGFTVDENHKLYVYIPCGVGGAPGGITYGIKENFGDNAYCFFAEPTHAPCMTLALASGMGRELSVGDIGIDGKTEADGLAVGRASGLVADAMKNRLSGAFTVDDSKLYPYMTQLKDIEGIFIEPSACAAFEGLKYVCGAKKPVNEGSAAFAAPDENSIHIIWATGGNMVPEDEKKLYYERGKAILEAVAEVKAQQEAAAKASETAEEEKKEPVLTGQEAMEEHVMKTLHENNILQKDTLNGLMKGYFKDCSYDDKTLTFVFPVQQWQANRGGNMHGGAISTAFDLSMGALCRFYAKEFFAPTVSLEVKFIRPVPLGDKLVIKTKATATGRRITQLTAEGYVESTGKLAATAASVYMNVNTNKERKKKD